MIIFHRCRKSSCQKSAPTVTKTLSKLRREIPQSDERYCVNQGSDERETTWVIF